MGVRPRTAPSDSFLIAALGASAGGLEAFEKFGARLLPGLRFPQKPGSKQCVFGGGRESMVSVVFNPDHGKASIKLEHLLSEFSISGGAVQRGERGEEREQWSIHYRLPERAQHEFLAALAQMPEVIAIERPPSTLGKTERERER